MDNKNVTNIIKKSIKMELDAQKLYESLGKKSKTYNAKTLFNTLVVEEQKHEVLLKEYLNSGNIEAARAKINTFKTTFTMSNKIIDVSYDSIELREGMIKAVQLEKKAAKTYLDLFEKTKKYNDLLLDEVLTNLIREEKKHESLIIIEYRKLFGIWEED